MSYFIVPLVADARGYFVPKYVPALCADWRIVDFGNACLVHASTTPAADAQIAANLDVIAADDQALDSAIPAGIGVILEALGLPSGLAVNGMTHRVMFRRFVAMAQIVHRIEEKQARAGVGGKLNLLGRVLDIEIGNLPAATRQRWADAATELGLDISGINATDPVREVLRNLGFQIFAGRVVRLGNL